MKKLEAECCDVTCVHYDAVEKAKVHMPAENLLKDLAEFYKVFADTTRVRILYVLLESEMCGWCFIHMVGMRFSMKVSVMTP